MVHSLYQIIVRDRTGAVVYLTDRFRALTIEHMVNHVSSLQLALADEPHVAAYLGNEDVNLDNLIEIRRSSHDLGFDWYTEYVGFHRTAQREVTSTDLQILTSYSRGLLDLIKRSTIRYYADTNGSVKGPAPADDVIKEYVRENAGSLALISNGRVTDHVLPGLTVAADLSQAPTHESANAWDKLLDAIRGIGEPHSVDFDVVWGGPSSPITFEFRTYYPRLGTDRTSEVVFAMEFGNMLSPSYTRSRTEEITDALVLGPGEGPLRDTTHRTSVHTGDSPWNIIEENVNASNEDRAVALEQAGDDLLYEKRPANGLTFDVLQTPQFAYGRHYFLGDLITARFKDIELTLKIRAVRLTIGEDGREDVTLTLEEVPE